MIVIKKITVKYSPEEDRLCLATETVYGDVLVLWLTARLAVRLVDHLLNKVDQMKQPSVATKLDSSVKQQAIKQWEQSVANMVKKPAPEVNVKTEDREKLISSVDVGQLKDRHVLVFRWGKKDGARMMFTSVEMCQWQQILYTNFKTAGWSMNIWPDWYGQQQVAKKQPKPICLH